MSQDAWSAVDAFIEDALLPPDPVLDAAIDDSRAAGMPMIAVAPVQGKWLMLLARAMGAKRILEVGTLGGYSTIWLARGMAPGGRIVTLELVEKHAAVARKNLARAGVAESVDVRVGRAIEILPQLAGPFDLVFIDADKESGADYFDHAVRLARPGSVIVVDNVVREGGVIDPKSDDPMVRGTRRLFERVKRDPRVDATAVQTVGRKEWDGFLMAVVR